MDLKEGRIYFKSKTINHKKHDEEFIILDAEPGIMNKVRPLFPKSRFSEESGQFTHRPLIIYISNESCKDVDWILGRYNLEISKEDRDFISKGAKKFDNTKFTVQEIIYNKEFSAKNRVSEKGFVPISNAEKRSYQEVLLDFADKVNSKFLVADEMGIGKTVEAALFLQMANWRPAIVVVPVNISGQWKRKLESFFPDFKIIQTKDTKLKKVPDDVDVVITNYSKISSLIDTFLDFNPKSIIFDEVQELRRSSSDKYHNSKRLASMRNCIGLSGTPFYNYGAEIFSVLNAINPGCLGVEARFRDEWCEMEKITRPDEFNKYLISNGLMVRRTAAEVGLLKPDPIYSTVEIDSDIESLKNMEDVAKKLALSVVGADAIQSARASREFSIKLRQATGVAKAKSVAEFVSNMVDNGEKVMLCGWHREFWDIVTAYFHKKGISYRMITGEESANQKDQSSVDIQNGKADVLCVSLRSGAGIDGLQNVMRVCVFGELDWSKNAMKQLIDRLARPGQLKQVLVYFLTVNDGSDPSLMNIIDLKDGQFKGIIEGKKADEASLLKSTFDIGENFVKEMAQKYLESIGENIVPEMVLSGEAKILRDLLESMVLPNSSEDAMQLAMHRLLSGSLNEGWLVKREYKFSEKSRLDFLVEHVDSRSKFVIECKNNSRDRAGVYRQIRRYISEVGVKEVFLVGPWNGVKSFELDGAKVITVDTTKARLAS